MARQANITASDEHGFTWVVAEGDPGWAAASYAKKILLLDKPVLPRQLLHTGWPDIQIHRAVDSLLDTYAANLNMETLEEKPAIMGKLWLKSKRAFQAYRTQAAVYGASVPTA